MFRIFDASGTEQDIGWLQDKYGDIIVVPEDESQDCFKLIAMYENTSGESGLKVTVLDVNGDPDGDRNVAFSWSGADYHEDGCATMATHNFVAQNTNANGDTAFGMGNGAYYWPPETGPHGAWVCSGLKSDSVHNLGMLSGKNHWHMDLIFQHTEQDPTDPTDPGEVTPPVIEPIDECPNSSELITSYTGIIMALIDKMPNPY